MGPRVKMAPLAAASYTNERSLSRRQWRERRSREIKAKQTQQQTRVSQWSATVNKRHWILQGCKCLVTTESHSPSVSHASFLPISMAQNFVLWGINWPDFITLTAWIMFCIIKLWHSLSQHDRHIICINRFKIIKQIYAENIYEWLLNMTNIWSTDSRS